MFRRITQQWENGSDGVGFGSAGILPALFAQHAKNARATPPVRNPIR
jgi:hypothetical protein